ncbi:MAG: hypothetical protein CVT89_01825 [Candidatus Altiarchaeales archaeon HGW-Altiarchaeales-2]|nr:MAG: hypothetical protein CVT89_01825 [Candidatus Altiarchaeales archaeon HGW-Altiarchaeales-2]
MAKNNMKKTAFMAHSFEDDESVKKVINSFKNIFSCYFDIITGEEPSSDKSISEKIRNMIKKQEVFIGIITKRKNSEWNTSAWVLTEATIAVDFNKPILLLVEKDIKENDIGIIGKVREYIHFDPNDISECIPKVLKILNDMNKTSPENNLCFPYKFRAVINRITIYPDGRGIYDRRCVLEVLSDDFKKVTHGIGIGDDTPKTTVLQSWSNLKTTKISDRFTKDQCLFWRIFKPQNIILGEKDVLYEDEWKDKDVLKGFNFSFNFGKFPIGSIIEYSYGLSCKGMFPWIKRQMENGELYKEKTNKLSDWMEVRSEVDKLTIIIQFDHDYGLKGTPELRITMQEGEKVTHNYKFEKEDSLFYETYKVTMGRTTPGFKYVVEWKPEIL